MKKRKLIGLLTAVPESLHAKRVLEGVTAQCAKYDYDVAVFANLMHFSIENKDYLKGENNIYELVNFDLLDGVIVDCISFIEEGTDYVKQHLQDKLTKECKKPVVALSVPMAAYDAVLDDDAPVFRQIVTHVLDVHKISDIYFLTGHKGYAIAEERVEIFKGIMAERGLEVTPDRIFYGDFWFTGGAALADKIISGEVRMPRAVICASDHMAIGLVNKLNAKGIRVPEDVLVTGFEATQEAAINPLSITSFESNMVKVAADAVDLLRGKMDGGLEISPFDCTEKKYIHAGMSCGCEPDFIHSASAFRDSFYFMCYDWTNEDILGNVDIGVLMEALVPEQLSSVNTPLECLEHICDLAYLISTNASFYLCLKENWLDLDDVTVTGYPEKMKLVVTRTPISEEHTALDESAPVFDTALMFPKLFEDREEAEIFFFSAVHFQEKMLGYAVLQHSLKQKSKAGIVYRNWLRNVNISLEHIRAKNRLQMLSIYDEMTGVYNRRGMNEVLSKLLAGAREGDSLFAAVVDMDGLKCINDNYGHSEGDYGIKTICECLIQVARPGEICVRAGGDEFYLIGVGDYAEDSLKQRVESFNAYVQQRNRESDKPYLISASMGCAIERISKDIQVGYLLNTADVEMYRNKIERKKQRL